MTTIRPRLADVQSQLGTLLRADSEAAANGNGLVSRAEQTAAPAHVQQAAELVRAQGGPGTRVTVDALDTALGQQAQALLAQVNQGSGSGAPFLSLAEAEKAAALNPALGGRVMKARDIVLNKGVDTDGIARALVRAQLAGNDGIFKTFATLTEAENFRGPADKSVFWLVVTGETPATKSYVQGRNDLWSERFDISKSDGTVTVTAQH
jgi:hypothetical protein